MPWSRRPRAAACRGWADLLAAAICSERVLAALRLGCAVADLVSAACRSSSQRRAPAVVDAAVAGCVGKYLLAVEHERGGAAVKGLGGVAAVLLEELHEGRGGGGGVYAYIAGFNMVAYPERPPG